MELQEFIPFLISQLALGILSSFIGSYITKKIIEKRNKPINQLKRLKPKITKVRLQYE